ncbi:hypothetical protein A6A04_00655 [Paramagnetospirillum marisnigri]|uniref:Uncharacterized protein n=1 Tax=Paramagnetospirillum marisnigri TaxID=1285242 RepID=A0A178MRW1_9PROT|nr:hypothetical protein [Paramagnetospirillum marisnigri]OAN52239.1 hypothetical protein A6A04_00655 [Paramagnetospirillum marisnigri]
MAPRTVTLILDADLARRFDAYVAERGGDEAAALEHALVAFLDAEDKARGLAEAVAAAAREGDESPAPARSHDDIRRWLLSWGSESEKKQGGTC